MQFCGPRFSIRWLLIGFAVLTVVFYLLFVRPTVIANQFARAIKAGDFTLAASMLNSGDESSFAMPYSGFSDVTTVAEIFTREWTDIWHFRRSISVRLSVSTRDPGMRSAGGLPMYQQTAVYEAGPFRVRQIKKQGMHMW